MKRPLDLRLVATYYAVFSLVWLWLVAREIRTEVAFAALFAICIALLPGVIALGLWTFADGARIASVAFALIHAAITLAWLLRPHHSKWLLSELHVVADGLIVACMCRPGMLKLFRAETIQLRLDANPIQNHHHERGEGAVSG